MLQQNILKFRKAIPLFSQQYSKSYITINFKYNESRCRHFVTTSQNKMVPEAIPNTRSNELPRQI
jgi:hypothetical protein